MRTEDEISKREAKTAGPAAERDSSPCATNSLPSQSSSPKGRVVTEGRAEFALGCRPRFPPSPGGTRPGAVRWGDRPLPLLLIVATHSEVLRLHSSRWQPAKKGSAVLIRG